MSDTPMSEIIPGVEDGVSAIAGANAPFIFVDGCPTYGFSSGVGNITVEALRFQGVGGKVVRDRVIVAHLRMGIHGLLSLKSAFDAMLLQATPAANQETKPS